MTNRRNNRGEDVSVTPTRRRQRINFIDALPTRNTCFFDKLSLELSNITFSFSRPETFARLYRRLRESSLGGNYYRNRTTGGVQTSYIKLRIAKNLLYSGHIILRKDARNNSGFIELKLSLNPTLFMAHLTENQNDALYANHIHNYEESLSVIESATAHSLLFQDPITRHRISQPVLTHAANEAIDDNYIWICHY